MGKIDAVHRSEQVNYRVTKQEEAFLGSNVHNFWFECS
jgi:hypothetical protein